MQRKAHRHELADAATGDAGRTTIGWLMSSELLAQSGPPTFSGITMIPRQASRCSLTLFGAGDNLSALLRSGYRGQPASAYPGRTFLVLDKDASDFQQQRLLGNVVELALLGALHDHYVRV